MGKLSSVLVITLLVNVHIVMAKLVPNKRVVHDYEDALKKSILFFEGQRSGKLPASQRMTWRNNSALHDGSDVGVDLVGGYYDAGDNVKFNFPMAFSTTMLAWSVLEFGKFMELEKQNALDAVRWATDYLLKATAIPGVVYAQVGDPYSDHNCWERPEDMDTLRTSYAVTNENPGSEVSGEIAAALAAASLAFKIYDRQYSKLLLSRAIMIFEFADNYRGSYNDSLGPAVCPFYCDFNGYQDELAWAATWLHKATKATNYWNYVTNNVQSLNWNFAEFGWDSKIAGINILASKFAMNTSNASLFIPNADKFVCSILLESPTRSVEYSPGGLLFKPGGSNLQHATTLSFLMVVYARYLNHSNSTISCGNITVTPPRLVHFANTQVDYILGTNPMNMSYMVGYGNNFPKKIHHRGSSLPSITQHPSPMACQDGNFFFTSNKPNPNLLIGAVVGGPDINDLYVDTRTDYVQSEPTTYINAPLVGTLAYFKARPTKSQRSTNYLHKR